jgi:hypothetical protein
MGSSVATRLGRLEALTGSTGPCPLCADWRELILLRDKAPEPPCCPVCGRQPFVVRLVRDPNFYHNRERLDALEEV